MTVISYPESNNSTGYYLAFTAYDYAKATQVGSFSVRDAIGSGGALARQLTNGIADFFQTNEVDPSQNELASLFSAQNGNTANQPLGQNSGSGNKSAANTGVGSVYLYLPPKLEYKYGAEWQKMSLGALGSVFTEKAVDLPAIGKAMAATGATYLAEQIKSALKNVPKAENVDIDNYIGASFGIVFNDNTIQTFDRMQTRQFQFDYLMVARNSTEETNIRRIIKFFKEAMHPTSKQSGRNNSLTLGYPYVFRIRPAGSFKKENVLSFLPQTKYCGLVGFNVDYTPDNVISLTPGQFVQAVRISLSFNEITSLTRQDINDFEDTSPTVNGSSPIGWNLDRKSSNKFGPAF